MSVKYKCGFVGTGDSLAHFVWFGKMFVGFLDYMDTINCYFKAEVSQLGTKLFQILIIMRFPVLLLVLLFRLGFFPI